MNVTEIFYSIQGEGRLTGVPSSFVRLAGCPLRCTWCDTIYGWDHQAGKQYTVEQIIQQVCKYNTRFAVVTGGEPLVNPDMTIRSELPGLIARLKNTQKHVTIETAGLAFVPDLHCDLMSISPKLTNSAPQAGPTLDIAVLTELVLNYDYQLKFVVDSPDDIDEINRTLEEIQNVDPEKVMLMPQASTRQQLIEKSPMVAELCKQTGYSFSNRLHIMLWDNKPGV